MSCGCKPSRIPLHVIQTTAGMCSACSRRDGTVCEVSYMESQWHRKQMVCPRNRFPDAAGVVTWLGVRWIGVPWPIRLWLVATAGVERPEDFSGCGCLVAAKGLVARLAAI